MTSFKVRAARPGDEVSVHEMISELARFEKMEDELEARAEDLARELFCPHPILHGFVAEDQQSGVISAYALYYYSYSTFKGRRSIYLEDLYVRPPYRGRGQGKALLLDVFRVAASSGACRVEWSALDWNKDAINFYRSLGAETVDGWDRFRILPATIDGLIRETNL